VQERQKVLIFVIKVCQLLILILQIFKNVTEFYIIYNEIISAIEDPCDGFRSAMRTLIKHRNVVIENTFPPIKVIGVEMPSDYDRKNDAIEFFDSITGKIVLSVGTENVGDYYPIFISRFNPENMVCNVVN